ncbi:acyl-CoA dehydrogenase family protein [Gordonia jinhuaensis]|uniref:Acyl-CoA dehydrogenase n=1 Tax=Gordonia jinhuaensis TaxID=1517702 RepID=A0A916SXD6_9ACTN|nr:acyl-CoA dehydrogenase family protein [Gordonia jinhuaensis]GGB20432.1 acyl-CoA dehydrogenase [Gordonia jinhuaensis]
MDFTLTEEQVMLRDTARDVFSTYDIEKLRAAETSGVGWDPKIWASLAEIGILGLPFAEDAGGTGAGPVEVSAIMGEIGRSLAPEPVLHAAYIPGVLIDRAAAGDRRTELLTEVSEGRLRLAFAHEEPDDRWPSAAVETSATAGSDGVVLSGKKYPVFAGDTAHKFVVSARRADGSIGLFLVDSNAAGVTVGGYHSFDGRRGAEIVFDQTPAVELAEGDQTPAIAYAEAFAQTALCAEAVGAMAKALELTTEYLKSRKQFGVTLSKFQALTHRAADIYVLLELASSMSLYATASLADDDLDPLIYSRAKLQIATSSRKLGQEAIQLHGGIGMTAEYPVGHYVARLTAISQTLGNADAHRATLAAHVGEYDMVTVTD